MAHFFRGFVHESEQVSEPIAAEWRIACDNIERTGCNTARRIIHQSICDNHVRIAQKRVTPPADSQRFVDIGAKKAFGGQSTAFMSHAKKNAFSACWINQRRARVESLAMNHFQQVPNKFGDQWGSEKLPQPTPSR